MPENRNRSSLSHAAGPGSRKNKAFIDENNCDPGKKLRFLYPCSSILAISNWTAVGENGRLRV
ncbi:MAG: hypothetical protein AB2531_14620, partial [Candidatus Thiodiazotropha sp.]